MRTADHRCERGQATVELALLLPIVVLLLGVIVHVGALATDHVRLWHAAREAARVAVVDPDPSEIRAAVDRVGLSDVELQIDPPAGDRERGEPLTIELAYRPATRIPLIGSLFGRLTMTSTATMRIEEP